MLSRRGGYLAAHSEVRQRVLSARRLRIKTFQNQLADAQQTISDLAHENRLLRSLHKRQDSALAKYESNNAELPQLLHSHAEELRVWQTKYRNLQNAHKDLESKLKQKEREMLALSDENKYYIQLSKDKHLDERQRLKDKVAALEARLQSKDNEMQLLVRKLKLYAKNHKLALQAEQKKVKEMMGKLEKARMELSGYSKLEEINFMQCKMPSGTKPIRKKLFRSEDGGALKTPEELYKLETVLEKNGSSCENSLFEDTEGSQAGSTRTPKSSCTVREASKKMSSSTTTVTIGQQTASTTHLAAPKAVPKQRRIDIGDGDAPSCEPKKIVDPPPKGSKVYSPVPAKRHTSPPPPGPETRKVDRRDTPRIRAQGGEHNTRQSVIYGKDEVLYGGGGGGDDDEEAFSDGDDDEEEDDDDEDDVQVGGLTAPQMYGDGDHEKSEDLSHRSESYGCGSAGSVANSPSPFHDDGDGDGVDEEAFLKFKRLAAKESMVYLLETGDKEPKKGNNNNNQKSSKSKLEPVKNPGDYNKAPAKGEPRSRPISGAGFKSEISTIRKQISDDYKEREAFLDTFCRQAGSGGGLQDEPPPMPKKRNSIALGRNIPPNRKHKLLAALKAIDDNRSQE